MSLNVAEHVTRRAIPETKSATQYFRGGIRDRRCCVARIADSGPKVQLALFPL